ncbi:MAG: FtsX-like permease family protein [Cytophagales bacterium]|nr:MAG: FtsX-like permease family protein [Cytophagales bacterium]TAF60245.1 MAG: FtsX-like permease family protein [Cytophagales bacterium]
MQLSTNIQESLKAIKENKLRSGLTMSIITLGIMSLVGILTAIDSIKSSVMTGLTDLGAKSFDITDSPQQRRTKRKGVSSTTTEPISYKQAKLFKENYRFPAKVCLYGWLSYSTEVKYKNEKTNPNSSVIGTDDNFLLAKGMDIEKGRNLSPTAVRNGGFEAVIGPEIAAKLFKKENPIDKAIQLPGGRYKVVGVIKSRGGLAGNASADRYILIPLLNAQAQATETPMSYSMICLIDNPEKLDEAMAEAVGVMRRARLDKPSKPDSFTIVRSESLAQSLEETSTNIQLGGFLISFITLLGASIGLMNIMLVSVTERTREIGIRKAIGARPQDIRSQFLIEAVVICQIGGIVGVIAGLIMGNVVARFIGNGGFVIPWAWIGAGLITCFVVGIISGFYPARKASKLDPIESLRYE